MNFQQYFSTFLEASTEWIAKIQDAVDKVEDRPFGELFGSRDRFMVRVWNPKFEKAVKALDLDISKFDWKTRTYAGHHLNTFIKRLRTPDFLLNQYQKHMGPWDDDDYEGAKNDLTTQFKRTIAGDQTFYNTYRNYSDLKQVIDQNDQHYYLVFSRHPIDVLRMSDHKGISSCHRIDGGKYSKDRGDYAHCALADARNDGGVVYLIKGRDARRIKERLMEQDVFEDRDRDVGHARPIGRIRLRRFIDLQTGKDTAIPTALQDEQKYGMFTTELYQVTLDYLRKNQQIYKNPPDAEYAKENIVMVGGSYSDEQLSHLLNNFFGRSDYDAVRHKSKHMTTWKEEIKKILSELPALKVYNILKADVVSGNKIDFRYEVNTKLNSMDTAKIRDLEQSRRYTEEEITKMMGKYVVTQYRVSLQNQTVNTPPKLDRSGPDIWFNATYRTHLYDPQEIRQLVQYMQHLEKDKVG